MPLRFSTLYRKTKPPVEISLILGVGGGIPPARAKDRGRPRRPARQSRATQKSFLFLLPARRSLGAGGEEKIGRAQIGKSKENFFVGRAGFRHGGGTASLWVLLKMGSSKVQNFPPKSTSHGMGCFLVDSALHEQGGWDGLYFISLTGKNFFPLRFSRLSTAFRTVID